MKGKLRPVGSPVPFPRIRERQELPWAALYHTEFMCSGTEALSLAVSYTHLTLPTNREV